MKILILGAGKMGSFFVDLLSFDHETAVYDTDPKRLRFMYNTLRFTSLQEIKDFEPELVINAVTLKYTLEVFRQIEPYLPVHCILSDIASVKTDFLEYYNQCGHPYVSTHPMFGPTFANLGALSNENAIIISDGDYMGRIFFKDLYQKLGLHICEYSFKEHDEIVAYSLSIPFVSTFVFAAVMKPQDAPGTTFKRHMAIAKGVLNEDETLLREILFNPHTVDQVAKIREELKNLIEIIDNKDPEALAQFIARIKANALR
ncbi:MAG: prephenate dehydrogenase [Bacteroidaceae bacterium]